MEKFKNQVRFQNGQVIDLAILKPGFELARPLQNQGRFQKGQVNNLAVSKRPGNNLHCFFVILDKIFDHIFTSHHVGNGLQMSST